MWDRVKKFYEAFTENLDFIIKTEERKEYW